MFTICVCRLDRLAVDWMLLNRLGEFAMNLVRWVQWRPAILDIRRVRFDLINFTKVTLAFN